MREATKKYNKVVTLAEKMAQMCRSIDGFIHELPRKKIYEDTKNRLAKFETGEKGPKSGPGKVLMLVGATGAGKSTLINGMINYVYGVKWEDPFRFKLIVDEGAGKFEAHSQTKWITAYVLHQQEGFHLPSTLTLIDTPGFGDTEGIKADDELRIQIHEFFSHGGNIGVDQLDGICFVVQASLPRLTPAQKYIFDSILAVLGKDVENIIYVLTTFASREKPLVLTALKAAKIPTMARAEMVRQTKEEASGERLNAKGVLNELIKDFNVERTNVLNLTMEAHQCLQKLDKIALKPDPLRITEYVDFLIESEKREAKPGFEQRITYLLDVKEREKLAKKLKDDYDPFEECMKEFRDRGMDMSDFDWTTSRSLPARVYHDGKEWLPNLHHEVTLENELSFMTEFSGDFLDWVASKDRFFDESEPFPLWFMWGKIRYRVEVLQTHFNCFRY
ncbi:unnamed protein product [Darwinula stevensoni]|uniref:Septin-type G domain-containing protein n=1 Tax=Darwinula stevensoni TaxID=69355 RepID=A0A7R9A5H2_9CRUS|nr:unnamed protein product [Darwinula stevensoni]CAG0885309.1 unnamed protein product [Darwinula stevensoni]